MSLKEEQLRKGEQPRPNSTHWLFHAYSTIQQTGKSIDRRFRHWEQQYGHQALRYSLALVFFWFGITKPLAISPADAVVRPTLASTPILSDLISFQAFFSILGTWEALVGLGLLWRRTVRLAVACMCLQMLSTFTPLFVVPTETFRWWPLVPSAVGLYIVKNFALATAGLVVAVHDSEPLFRSPRLQRIWSSGKSYSKDRIERLAIGGRELFETIVPARLTIKLLHGGLALVFIWSGILTISVTPDPGTWIASVIPSTIVADSVFIPLFGGLELTIGAYLLIHRARATHFAAYLSIAYIAIAMLPIALAPAQVFATMPFEPTFEGVYIFKDLILVSGILTIDAYQR